jgi:transposase
MEFKFFIGVDVSKDTLDFAVYADEKIQLERHTTNDTAGIKDFLKELKKSFSAQPESFIFCMEHTGIYCNHLLEYLGKQKIAVWIENPLAIKTYFGIDRGKSDRVDAQRIAEYAYYKRSKIRIWEAPRDVVKKLKNLLSIRDRLVKTRTALQVSITSADGFVDKDLVNTNKKITEPIIEKLNVQLKMVERKIQEIINKDPGLKHLSTILNSVTGIGMIVSANIIAATNEFKSIDDPRKMACHSGLAPFTYESGKSIRGRSKVSHRANKKLKTLFHLAARAAISAKGELRDYYLRKVQEGKNKMAVLNAVGNKLIHRAFACIKHDRLYEKNYLPALAKA